MDGTLTNSQRGNHFIFSQRCFLSFKVVLHLKRFLARLDLISYLMLLEWSELPD